MQDNSEVATGKEFLYFRKKYSMTRKTAQEPWKKKNTRKKQSTPQNRITDKLGNLGMSNQNVYRLRAAHLGYLLKAEVAATRASPTLIRYS